MAKIDKEDIDKLDVRLVEVNGCAMVLDITYDEEPIKRIEI